MDYSNILHSFPYSLYPPLGISTSHANLVSSSLSAAMMKNLTGNSSITNPGAVKPPAYPSSTNQLIVNNKCISNPAQQHFVSSSSSEHESLKMFPHRLLAPPSGAMKMFVSAAIAEAHQSITPSEHCHNQNERNYERTGKFQYTNFEGEEVPCFCIGGEKRLCLPQVLHLLPVKLTLEQVNELMDSLGIICTRCKPVQLQLLKEKSIFSSKVPACGLITKSDAERLYKHLQCKPDLLNKRERATEMLKLPLTPSNTYNVVHYCFGKQVGKFYSDLYTHEKAKAVECNECFSLFTPEEFVGHSHSASERNTCHWGFDSINWRHYLILSEDHQPINRLHQSTEDYIYSQELLRQQFDRVKYRFAREESRPSNSLPLPAGEMVSENALDSNKTNSATQLSSIPPRKRLKLKGYDQEHNSPSIENPTDIPERLTTPTSLASSETIEKVSPIVRTPTLVSNGAMSTDEYSPISDNPMEESVKQNLVNPFSNNTAELGPNYDFRSCDAKWQTLVAMGTRFIDAVWEDPEIGLHGKNNIIEAFGQLWQAYCEQLESLNADRLRLRRMVISLEERPSPSQSSDSCGYLARTSDLKEECSVSKRTMELASSSDIHWAKRESSDERRGPSSATPSYDTNAYYSKACSPTVSNLSSPISGSATPHPAASPLTKENLSGAVAPSTSNSFTYIPDGSDAVAYAAASPTSTSARAPYCEEKDEECDILGPPDLDCEGSC